VTHIERRLEKLETQNRRLRAGFGALLLAGSTIFLVGASGNVANVVTARRMEIVDAAGHPVVALGEDNGHGFVALLDGAGNFKVHLAEQTAGGTITLKNQRNQDLVVMGSDDGGAGAIVTYDNGAREHVKIGTTHSGAGAVTTFGGDGARLISMTATTTGDGLVATFDRSGRVRASWP